MEFGDNYFQSLLNNIPGISYRCLFDNEWTMIFISAHVDQVTGYSADELLHNKEVSYGSLILTEDNIRATRVVTEAIAINAPWQVEYRVRSKSGDIRWASERGQAAMDEQGQVQYLDGFILDITAEKQAKQSVERLAVLVQNSSDAMFLVRNSMFVYCNEAALNLFGYSREELMVQHPAKLSPPQQADGSDSSVLAEHYIEQAAQGITQRFEWVHRHREGRLIDTEVSLSRIVEDDGIMVFAIVRDIRERKQRERDIQELNSRLEQRVVERTADLQTALEHVRHAQQELVQSEKLASLGALVAGVAHELNTPIGNAVTVSSILTDAHRRILESMSTGLTRSALSNFLQEVGEGSQIIERNLSRAAELIGSFKQLAVDQASCQRRQFKLSELAQEIILTMKSVTRRTSVVVKESIPDDIALDSYPGPLGQILMNLINNALIHGYNEQGPGVIQLKARPAKTGWIYLTISDEGRGMDTSLQKKIFDPFFTTRLGKGGSGLGLHIVYTLTTGILGGHIDVHSNTGEGSTFTLHLPIQPPSDSKK